MNQRFTIDGDAALEQHLVDVCEAVREGIRAMVPASQLEGLVLAGGYGRGEGGVLRTDDGDAPYNDLEFFVFIRGNTWLNDRRYRRALHDLGTALTPMAGIDVEFKVLSLKQFRSSAPTMFYYDLVMGHRWIIGDDTCFNGCDHHGDAARIPLHEATRLLFNRCTGLLFAKERLHRAAFTSEDADFVGRNVAKAQLALGDVLLASRGQYHWSCMERCHRLQRLLDVTPDLLSHHEQGVDFKLHPHRSKQTRSQLMQLHSEVSALAEQLFRQLESLRLNTPFDDIKVYASSPLNKCPEQPLWKNVLLNLRHRTSNRITRYPREYLLHQLASMLWGESAMNGTTVRNYEALWSRFN